MIHVVLSSKSKIKHQGHLCTSEALEIGPVDVPHPHRIYGEVDVPHPHRIYDEVDPKYEGWRKNNMSRVKSYCGSAFCFSLRFRTLAIQASGKESSGTEGPWWFFFALSILVLALRSCREQPPGLRLVM